MNSGYYRQRSQLLKAWDLGQSLVMLGIIASGNLSLLRPVFAQNTAPTATIAAPASLQCSSVEETAYILNNQGEITYQNGKQEGSTQFEGVSNGTVTDVKVAYSPINSVPQGITDSQGQSVANVGLITVALEETLQKQGLTADVAQQASLVGAKAYSELRQETTTGSMTKAVRDAIAQAFPDQQNQINQISEQDIALALTGTAQASLRSLGLSNQDVEAATNKAIENFTQTPTETPFNQTTEQMNQAVVANFNNTDQTEAKVATANKANQELLTLNYQNLADELYRIRSADNSSIKPGDKLFFKYIFQNTGTSPAKLTMPTAQTIQDTYLKGAGTVTQVKYETVNETGQPVTGDTTDTPLDVNIPAKTNVKLTVQVQLSDFKPTEPTTVNVGIGGGCDGSGGLQSFTLLPPLTTPLIDPLGRVTGCAGEILPDYRGFTIAVYDPDPNDPTGGIRELTPLTVTELPDDTNNNIPKGLEPNIENSNPFFLTNEDEGKYNFQLDDAREQLTKGRSYIVLINPPQNSIYDQRRIKMVIGDRVGNEVSYVATSLDGKPINATDGRTSVEGSIFVDDADTVGLDLGVLDLSASVCQAQEIKITKTGDRAAAEPGDTVLYRISITSLANALLSNITVNDLLPLGFKFESESVRAALNKDVVTLKTEQNDSNVTFTLDQPMDQGDVLNIVYAAQVTPDALRGSGKNNANVTGQRTDNNYPVKDGPAIHALTINSGIVADCGTLIGRVFVDKNFDGQQQEGEPGIPNAVIFLEDGNRITTDADGLFSLLNVLPGYHVGVLDLESIPGYTLAPNLYFKEANSQSRMVKMSPGSMVKMNFAVTPTFNEEGAE